MDVECDPLAIYDDRDGHNLGFAGRAPTKLWLNGQGITALHLLSLPSGVNSPFVDYYGQLYCIQEPFKALACMWVWVHGCQTVISFETHWGCPWDLSTTLFPLIKSGARMERKTLDFQAESQHGVEENLYHKFLWPIYGTCFDADFCMSHVAFLDETSDCNTSSFGNF